MSNLISKRELEAQNRINPPQPKEKYTVGEIYPTIFDNVKDSELSADMPLDLAIIWMGTFRIEDTSVFPRKKCPICGKEEVLIPYRLGASILSGAHVIQFYCSECGEQFVTNNDSDYYHLIRDYVIKNKCDLPPSPVLKAYSSAENDISFID